METTGIETNATSEEIEEYVPLPVPIEEVYDYNKVSMHSFQEVDSPKDLSQRTSLIGVANEVEGAQVRLHCVCIYDTTSTRFGDLKIRMNASKRTEKHLQQFKVAKRPETKRLFHTVQALGKGSGKIVRPRVADSIRLRKLRPVKTTCAILA